MPLQRQHFFISYLTTLNVGAAGVSTTVIPWQITPYPIELTGQWLLFRRPVLALNIPSMGRLVVGAEAAKYTKRLSSHCKSIKNAYNIDFRGQ